MNKDDIIYMAREAGLVKIAEHPAIERFADLVVAHERKSKNEMTKDDIIRMAKKTGYPIGHPEWLKATEEFAAVVAAHEREACAKVAEAYEPRCDTCPSGVANAIRARGQA